MKIEEYNYKPKNIIMDNGTSVLIVREKSNADCNSENFTLQLFVQDIESPIGFIWAQSKRINSRMNSYDKTVYIEVEGFEMKPLYRGEKIGKLLFNELVECGKECGEYAYIHGYYANGDCQLAKYYEEELSCRINYNNFSFRRTL